MRLQRISFSHSDIPPSYGQAIVEAPPASVSVGSGGPSSQAIAEVTSWLRGVAEALCFWQGLQLLQCVVLDLADSLSGDAEGSAYFFQGSCLVAVQSEAHLHHFALALG